jgi:hypothetical protein
VWLLLTTVGASAGVIVAAYVTGALLSLWGWLLGGLLGGGMIGGFQMIGLVSARSEKLIHFVQSVISWGAAFLLAHALLNGSTSALPGSISFVLSGIVGWGVLILLSTWAIIWMTPIPKKSYPRGHIRWWY